jgi:hypothetical protein
MPVDDAAIANDVVLWRRIYASWIHKQEPRPTSFAFRTQRDEHLSMYISNETTAERLLAGYDNCRIASLIVGFLRSIDYGVARDPVEGDNSHVLVFPLTSRKSEGFKKDARLMAEESKWV